MNLYYILYILGFFLLIEKTSGVYRRVEGRSSEIPDSGPSTFPEPQPENKTWYSAWKTPTTSWQLPLNGPPNPTQQTTWHQSWGDTSEEFNHRGHRRHRFCLRHPDSPRCNPIICSDCFPPVDQFQPPQFPPSPFSQRPPTPDVIKETWIENPIESTPHPEPEPHSVQYPSPQKTTVSYLEERPFGYLSEEARNAILKTCAMGKVNCMAEASLESIQKRQAILQQEMSVQEKVFSDSPSTYGNKYQSTYSRGGGYANEQKQMIENRLQQTQQLKQDLLNAAGLSNNVKAIDDGTFEQDILLTEIQSKSLMDQLKKYKRTKRAALFLEQIPAQRWDITHPILYYFDDNVETFEQNMVQQALQTIESATCIRFQQSTIKPITSYIYYAKIPNPTFCGLSYIGKIGPINPVYLSFMCQNPVGIALHETMHSLGVNHEHLRSDRDNYINIDWSNINPQFYDYFAISDSSKFTPYGVKYDYGSIMHYNAFTAAIDSSKTTMDPKIDRPTNLPLMGQRARLTPNDIQLLNKMYCKGQCVDNNVYCGVWAVRELCTQSAQIGWMQKNCRKSCNLC